MIRLPTIATAEVLNTMDWVTIMFDSYWKNCYLKLKNKRRAMAVPSIYQKREMTEQLVEEAVVPFVRLQRHGKNRMNFLVCLALLERTLDFVGLIATRHLFGNTKPNLFAFFYKTARMI